MTLQALIVSLILDQLWVLDEIAAGFELGDDWGPSGSASNSSRKWKGCFRRDATTPGLYKHRIKFKNGMRQHSFRLPSVKAKELWDKDQTYFDMLKEHLGGRVETSENWKCHPCFKEFGLRSAPLTLYGDAVPYVVGGEHSCASLRSCMMPRAPHLLQQTNPRNIMSVCE